MSADADYIMTTPALLKAAEHYTACAVFRTYAGESRHHCFWCGGTLDAHIIVALRTALANHAIQCPQCQAVALAAAEVQP